MKKHVVWGIALATAVAAVAAAGASARTHAWTQSTVATGLDSPRALTLSPNGDLLVAEGGHGGDVCRPSPFGDQCIGLTSRITTVDPATGSLTPLASGLFSSSLGMEGITGVDGIAASGGKLYATITGAHQQFDGWSCTNEPADCAAVVAAAKAQAGELEHVSNGGTLEPVADVGGHDFDLTAADPTLSGEGPNANPYGLTALPMGVWVADAGANLLDWIADDGSIHVSSRIPKNAPGGFPGDGVPTCVAVMRGNLYAADLSGRLWERGGSFAPTQIPLAGAHHFTGCVSDGLDHLYLVDMWGTPGPPIPAGPGSAAGSGSVIEFDRKSGTATTIAAGLDFPNGIALAKDGSLYVSVGSTCTAVGTPFPYCAKGGSIVKLAQS
jgi:glucose/arabinose dehydrogenase